MITVLHAQPRQQSPCLNNAEVASGLSGAIHAAIGVAITVLLEPFEQLSHQCQFLAS